MQFGSTRCGPVGGTVQSLACGWLRDAVNTWKVSRPPGLNPMLFLIGNRRVNHIDTAFRSYTSRTGLKLRPSGDRRLQCRSGGPCGDILQYVRREEFSSLWFMCLAPSFKLWRCERLVRAGRPRLVQRCATSYNERPVCAECSWPF
jgi:hypothetical protein